MHSMKFMTHESSWNPFFFMELIETDICLQEYTVPVRNHWTLSLYSFETDICLQDYTVPVRNHWTLSLYSFAFI